MKKKGVLIYFESKCLRSCKCLQLQDSGVYQLEYSLTSHFIATCQIKKGENVTGDLILWV